VENTPENPVVMYTLDPGDEGYDRGARWRLDDRGGNQSFFSTRDDAMQSMRVHGQVQINESEMFDIRRVGLLGEHPTSPAVSESRMGTLQGGQTPRLAGGSGGDLPPSSPPTCRKAYKILRMVASPGRIAEGAKAR
jgi:hypothetical protein